VTGPLGHLWSVVADVAVLLARYGWTRAAARARQLARAQKQQ
jgi:hypothetical protein